MELNLKSVRVEIGVSCSSFLKRVGLGAFHGFPAASIAVVKRRTSFVVLIIPVIPLEMAVASLGDILATKIAHGSSTWASEPVAAMVFNNWHIALGALFQ